jgi:SAM-dependent methyltransferase
MKAWRAFLDVLRRKKGRVARTPLAPSLEPEAGVASQPIDYRYAFSELLEGDGIEIGALHNPFRVPPGRNVKYVDKFTADEVARIYPDVPLQEIRVPDIVCSTGDLDAIEDESLGFIIASHVLEHSDNPLRLLQTWRRKLKIGGKLLIALPDCRFTFDRGRPLTSLEHLLWDFRNHGTQLKDLSDLGHIAECNLNMHESLDVESALELAKTILKKSRDTHFHVWTYDSFRSQLVAIISELGLLYRIDESACDEKLEMLFLLRAVSPTPATRTDA